MNNERYISVEKAVSILRLRSQQLAGMYGDIGGAASGAACILERLEDEEAEDVKPVVRGKWLDGRCTNCAWELPDYEYYGGCEIENVSCDEFNFCPNCGAVMREEVNDD